MLMFAFSAAVFSSVIWLFYAAMYVRNVLAGATLMEQSSTTVFAIVAIIVLPVLAVWMVFGYFNQFLVNRAMNRKQNELLTQLQKNQDYTDLVVRVMLDAEHEIKDGFVLNKFDVFIADMNEILSEIIQRCNIASTAQLDQLWQRVLRGEKWSLGKAILDASKNQNTFDAWVREKANRDKVFRGSLLEFCSRYQGLLMMLEKHDRDKVFLKMIESGVFGKVYSIIAPLTDGIKDLRASEEEQLVAQPERRTNDYASVLKLANMEEPRATESIVNVDKNDEETEERSDDEEMYEENPKRESFFARLNPFRKSVPESPFMINDEPDPFFQALHKGFKGDAEDRTPTMTAEANNMPIEPTFSASPVSATTASFGQSQNILNNLRATNENHFATRSEQNETTSARQKRSMNAAVADMAKTTPAAKPTATEEKDEDLVYPFGGWTDENNYNG